MISSEVQRTLVKSPPELWAELSDPSALARHLGDLGEIRIVRTEPEKTVEWAAENTTGTVSIQPSGWGTKVTLSVSREIPEQSSEPTAETQPAAATPAEAASTDTEPETIAAEPTAEAEPEPTAEAGPTAEAEAEPEPTAKATAEPEPTAVPESAPRRGFFARLFGRHRLEQTTQPVPAATTATLSAPATSAPEAFAAVRAALAQESFAAVHPFNPQPAAKRAPAQPTTSETAHGTDAGQESEAEQRTGTEQPGDISAELMAAEEVAAEGVTAVLAAVLDRLGAAHHRPFSRA